MYSTAVLSLGEVTSTVGYKLHGRCNEIEKEEQGDANTTASTYGNAL